MASAIAIVAGWVLPAAIGTAAHQPLANICVGATNQYSHTTKTNSSGVYTVPGLATGPYKVQFFDCGTGNHVPEFWNNQPNSTSANPVSVTVGSTTTNIN